MIKAQLIRTVAFSDTVAIFGVDLPEDEVGIHFSAVPRLGRFELPPYRWGAVGLRSARPFPGAFLRPDASSSAIATDVTESPLDSRTFASGRSMQAIWCGNPGMYRGTGKTESEWSTTTSS